MKYIKGGWMDFVQQVKSMIDYNLCADDYSLMMREYYILGKTPEQFVNREK
jgi:hypothetical protein